MLAETNTWGVFIPLMTLIILITPSAALAANASRLAHNMTAGDYWTTYGAMWIGSAVVLAITWVATGSGLSTAPFWVGCGLTILWLLVAGVQWSRVPADRRGTMGWYDRPFGDSSSGQAPTGWPPETMQSEARDATQEGAADDGGESPR